MAARMRTAVLRNAVAPCASPNEYNIYIPVCMRVTQRCICFAVFAVVAAATTQDAATTLDVSSTCEGGAVCQS